MDGRVLERKKEAFDWGCDGGCFDYVGDMNTVPRADLDAERLAASAL